MKGINYMTKGKMVERYFYPAIFNYEDKNGVTVEFPDFPDCATEGDTEAEALISAREYLGCVLYGMEEDGEVVPLPSSLNTIKTKLDERVVLVDVYMPSIRLASANRSVNRTVTLPAWLNAIAMERGINFSHVLQEALKKEFHLEQRKIAD